MLFFYFKGLVSPSMYADAWGSYVCSCTLMRFDTSFVFEKCTIIHVWYVCIYIYIYIYMGGCSISRMCCSLHEDSTWTCILITCSCVVYQALRFLGLYSGEMHAGLIVFANLVSVFMALVSIACNFCVVSRIIQRQRNWMEGTKAKWWNSFSMGKKKFNEMKWYVLGAYN